MKNKKSVVAKEFWLFIQNYPNPLDRDQFPEYLHTWNDFSDGKVWPESVVAQIYDDGEDEPEHYILTN